MSEEMTRSTTANWLYFGGTIAVTTVVVIFLYGWLHGFNTLGRNVAGAGQLMTAAAQFSPTPQGYPGVQGQPPRAGQFVCPKGGAVGMPVYWQGNMPQCPNCGQAMNFVTAGSLGAPSPQYTGRYPGTAARQW